MVISPTGGAKANLSGRVRLQVRKDEQNMINNVPALPFITVPQASAMYGVHANVITDAVRKGKLSSLNQKGEGKKRMDWRLDPRAVEVWVEKRKLDAERAELNKQKRTQKRFTGHATATAMTTSKDALVETVLDEMRKQTALLEKLVQSVNSHVGQMQEFNQLFGSQTEHIASVVTTSIKDAIG
jgi:hypothetical protein